MIYVLIASQGESDEYREWILGVFDNTELAEKEKNIYNHTILLNKTKYSNEEYTRLDKLEDEYYESGADEALLSDELKEFIPWRELQYNQPFPARIENYELNKI